MNFRRVLGGSKARRGFLALLLGTGFGNALALILSPVITRLFDPANFGSFTLVTAIAMVLTPLVSLRLDLAVPLAEREPASYAVVHAGLASALIMGAGLSALLFLVEPSLGEALGQNVMGEWLWTAPVMATSMACFTILNSLAIRGGRYRAIARRNVVMAATTLGLQIAAGALGFGVGGLILGFALGQIVGATSLLFGSGLRSADARAGRSLRLMGATLRRFRKIPLLLAAAGIISALGLQAPVLLFAHYYSSEVVGWFGLMQRVLAAPITLIGLSVAQVYLSEVSRTKRESGGQAGRYFWKASKALALMGLLLALFLLTAGPTAFEIVFGQDWRESGDLARAMALALAAQLVASPLSQTLVVFERNGLQLTWDVARLVVVAASIATAARLGADAFETAWVFGIALAFMYALSWNLSRQTVARASMPSTVDAA